MFAMMKPPIIKLMVAISDGTCRLERPMMAWPDVQPPAYLVPKPTRNPPAIIITNPRRVNKLPAENSCDGTMPE